MADDEAWEDSKPESTMVVPRPPEPKQEADQDENDAWDTEVPDHVIRERIEIKPPPPASFHTKSPEKEQNTETGKSERFFDKYANKDSDRNDRFNDRNEKKDFGGYKRSFQNDGGSPRRSHHQDKFQQRPGGFRRFSSTYRPRDAEYSPPRTFKDFVSQQDDRITPEEAVRKFEAYKNEVSRQVKKTFFEKNRLEDWFLAKFHPYYRTLEKIKTVRICRKRLSIFQKFYLYLKEHNINIVFDISNRNLVDYIKIINKLLDNKCILNSDENLESENDAETVNTKASYILIDTASFNQFLHSEFSKIVQKSDYEEIDLRSPLKRKFNTNSMDIDEDQESSSLDGQQKALNLGVEIRNIPVSIHKKHFLKILKGIKGFLRFVPYIMSPDNDSYKIIASFRPGTSFTDVKQALIDNPVSDYKPDVVIYNDTSPVIKSVRAVWNVNKIAFECIKISLTLIEKLDEEMFLYRGGLPILPEFDKLYKTFDPNAEDFNVKESESESESEKESSDESIEELTENPLIEQAKKVLDEISKYKPYEKCDSKILKILDDLILYLRLVHSFDFYSFHLEPMEHNMPCRLQNIYARKVVDSKNIGDAKVDNFAHELNQKFNNFVTYLNRYESSAMKKFESDLKDEKTELDKFMEAKLKEIRPNVWQCLACKKKFQSQEFVRKHLIAKHVPIIEAIKLNTIYFNNYFIDSQVVLEKVSDDRLFYSAFEDTENSSVPVISQPKKRKSLLKYDDDGDLAFDALDF